MAVNRIFKYAGNSPNEPAERWELDWTLGQKQLLAACMDHLKEVEQWTADKATRHVERIAGLISDHEDSVLRNVTQSIYGCSRKPHCDRKEVEQVFVPIFWAREGRRLAIVISQAVAEDEAFD